MNNNTFNLFGLLYALTNNEYSGLINNDDLIYMYNEKVQDVLFNTYIDILKLETIDDKNEQEIFMNTIAANYHLRLASLNEEEKTYVNKQILSILMPPEEKEKTKQLRKDND